MVLTIDLVINDPFIVVVIFEDVSPILIAVALDAPIERLTAVPVSKVLLVRTVLPAI